MSHELIARNPDLRKLEDDGYSLRIVDRTLLLVEEVPYATEERSVADGTLFMKLALSGDLTVQPDDHVAYWIGGFPHQADGSKLLALITERRRATEVHPSLSPAYMLSAKPQRGYRDHHHKATTYVELLSQEARAIDPNATAQRYSVAATVDDDEDVFEFADTASTRQNTSDLARKLRDERVAIVGVGGTGAYVLDFVAKTHVREIHLFDDDRFLQHNAFRAPGPFSPEEIRGGPVKSVFHAARYSRMRKQIVAHDTLIDATNVQDLAGFDTVFLCMDGHPIKAAILDRCVSAGCLLIDVGMGLYRAPDGSLAGSLRTTTCYADQEQHAQDCIDLAGDDAPGEYERNAQLAELNALNAALAVIRWKKYRRFYNDVRQEHDSDYVIDGNKLVNKYQLSPPQ